ncbi:MAG: carboxypeptidase regulatory-like domain-containing protein [Polyangiales bacterium]
MSRGAFVFFALSLVSSSCKRQEAPAPSPAPSASTNTSASASAPAMTATGTITGHVHFQGKLEPRAKIEHPDDPYCAKVGVEAPEITRLGNGDALLDSVVHLVNESAKGDPALAPKAVVHQKGCAYAPYAIGVLAGAYVEFVNDDRTMHNIHGLLVKAPADEDVINFALASGQPPRVVQAPKEPGIVRLKCDVHRWMRGWLVVSDHPWFASTNADGAFSLAKVPPGTHTVEAFHPLHGTKRKAVEVKANDTATADFTFTDADQAP